MIVFLSLRGWEHVKIISEYATTSDLLFRQWWRWQRLTDKESRDSLRILGTSTTPSGDSGKRCPARKKEKPSQQPGMGKISCQVWRIHASVSNRSPCDHCASGFRRRFARETARPVEGQTVGAVWNGSSSHQICWNTWRSYTRTLKKRLLHCRGGELSQVDAWPEDTLFAPMASIPRDDKSQPGPLDLRPITVTSLIYASWASTRFRDLRDWIARSVDELVVGGREGTSTGSGLAFDHGAWVCCWVGHFSVCSSHWREQILWSHGMGHNLWYPSWTWHSRTGFEADGQSCFSFLRNFSSRVWAVALCGAPVPGSSKVAHSLWWPQWKLLRCGQNSFEPRHRGDPGHSDRRPASVCVWASKRGAVGESGEANSGVRCRHWNGDKFEKDIVCNETLPWQRGDEESCSRIVDLSRVSRDTSWMPGCLSKNTSSGTPKRECPKRRRAQSCEWPSFHQPALFDGHSAIRLWDRDRTTIEGCQDPTGASGSHCFHHSHNTHRSKHMLFAFLIKEHTVDPLQAWLVHSLSLARRLRGLRTNC